MSTFTMPAAGTAEFAQLQARWESKPISFGQCNRIKQLFRDVETAGGYASRVPAKVAKVYDMLTERDADRRWVNLRSDRLTYTMWDAHVLMESLESLVSGPSAPATPVKPAKSSTPAPAKGHRKVTAPVESKPLVFNDGDLIIVAGETRRISVNGSRAYLARI